ncbi:MAG TPA: hypothetical protein VFP91_09725 [Vicinamibacterales bacterium]|nr:hypothetical protein [Vicinamibacterales bacterium]
MKAIAIALLVISASVVQAQTIDPTGHWKGTIEIPNGPMDFEMDIARGGRGELIGTVTAGADRVTLPLLNVTLDGSSITFYGRTDQQFHAELLPSGKALSGTASLNGYSLPFSMGRTGDARIDSPPSSPAVSKQLEGVWSGTLSAGEKTVRLSLTIANQPDGTSLAHSVSVDEGGLTIPTVVSQSGRSVKIETRGVITSYVATLNEAGTELSGTWTQGTTTLPLTMTRATVEGTR